MCLMPLEPDHRMVTFFAEGGELGSNSKQKRSKTREYSLLKGENCLYFIRKLSVSVKMTILIKLLIN